MRLIEWLDPDEIPRGLPTLDPAAVAIGAFDGVHRGHQELLHRTVSYAPTLATVVTFVPNPAAFTRPNHFIGNLSTFNQRVEWFAAAGIKRTVVVRFSEQFAQLPGKRFVEHLRQLFPGLAHVVVGFNFHLGRNRDTHATEMKQLLAPGGVHLDIVEALKDNEGSISSSRIRSAVLNGRLDIAAAMLGRPYEIEVTTGLPHHRSDGVQLLPPAGRYRVTCVGQHTIAEGFLTIDSEGHLGWHVNADSCNRIQIFESNSI